MNIETGGINSNTNEIDIGDIDAILMMKQNQLNIKGDGQLEIRDEESKQENTGKGLRNRRNVKQSGRRTVINQDEQMNNVNNNANNVNNNPYNPHDAEIRESRGVLL